VSAVGKLMCFVQLSNILRIGDGGLRRRAGGERRRRVAREMDRSGILMRMMARVTMETVVVLENK
jgi:hypothetical protein